MDNQKMINYETICAAVAGEKWATETVLEHYASYIEECSTEEIPQPDGTVIRRVNEDVKQRISLKLLEEIRNFPLD